jgi:hypothetical protein
MYLVATAEPRVVRKTLPTDRRACLSSMHAALPELLARSDIFHYQITNLGGLHRKPKVVSDDLNTYWEIESFRD